MTTPFVFSEENIAKAKAHIAKYPPGRQASAVLAILDLAQRQNNNWLSQAAIEAVAELLQLPLIRVQEVATFYTLFHLKPVGKYHLNICGTPPCYLQGARELRQICEKKLGVASGEVSADGLFSFTEVECLGGCVKAPVVQVNDDYYENLSPPAMEELLQSLEKKI